MVLVDNYDSFTYNLAQVGPQPGLPPAGAARTSPGPACYCHSRAVPEGRNSACKPPHQNLRHAPLCTRWQGRHQTGLSLPTVSQRPVSACGPSLRCDLVQYLGDLGCDHVVVRNDERTVAQLRELDPRGILLGPGPGERAVLAGVSTDNRRQTCLDSRLTRPTACAVIGVSLPLFAPRSKPLCGQCPLVDVMCEPGNSCRKVRRRSAGRPEDSGIALQVVTELGPELPVFGVCMGHQCIGQVWPPSYPGQL